jgi:hypothetical protein
MEIEHQKNFRAAHSMARLRLPLTFPNFDRISTRQAHCYNPCPAKFPVSDNMNDPHMCMSSERRTGLQARLTLE